MRKNHEDDVESEHHSLVSSLPNSCGDSVGPTSSCHKCVVFASLVIAPPRHRCSKF